MTTVPFPLPGRVAKMVNGLTEHDFEPKTTWHPESGTILVEVSNSRVVARSMWRRRGHRGYDWVDGTLLVDGLRCPAASTYEELRIIFDDPDRHLSKRRRGTDAGTIVTEHSEKYGKTITVPPEGITVADPELWPPLVYAEARMLVKRQLNMRVEDAGDGIWYVIAIFAADSLYVLIDVRSAKRLMLMVDNDRSSATIIDSVQKMMDLLRLRGRTREAPPERSSPKRRTQAPRSSNDHLVAKSNTVIRF